LNATLNNISVIL